MPPPTKLDINIEIDVLTAGTAAEVVTAVLELLLYQRHQIPFVYKTYKYYVDKWREEEDGQKGPNEDKTAQDEVAPTIKNFNIERQRELATKTKDSISAMRELIKHVFETNDIRCLRFLFGSTIHTPFEAYSIHIPTAAISRTHSHLHHRLEQTFLNQSLITLLTSENLYKIFSKNLGPTNVFLELEMLDNSLSLETTNAKVFPTDFCELPGSCRHVELDLVHSKPLTTHNSMALQCCKELQVYKDMLKLSLSQTEPVSEINNTGDQKQDSVTGAWWESEIFVRGFKENPLKSSDFWSG